MGSLPRAASIRPAASWPGSSRGRQRPDQLWLTLPPPAASCGAPGREQAGHGACQPWGKPASPPLCTEGPHCWGHRASCRPFRSLLTFAGPVSPSGERLLRGPSGALGRYCTVGGDSWAQGVCPPRLSQPAGLPPLGSARGSSLPPHHLTPPPWGPSPGAGDMSPMSHSPTPQG